MGWTDELQGRRGRPFEMSVETGKCREFDAAVRPSSWSLPTSPERAPVTFLATARFWCPEDASAWHGIQRDYRRVLHGEQEFTFAAGPPRPGARLRGVEHVDRVHTKTGRHGPMTFTETVVSFSDVTTGAAVASSRATSITFAEPTTPRRDETRTADWLPPEGHDLLLDLMTPRLAITDFVRYQGASGDFNPIHHDDGFARAAGYPGPIAVGMLAAGVAGTALSAAVDAAAIRRFRARWHSPAWPGDRLRYRVHADPAQPGRHLVAVTRETGHLHMTAEADTEVVP